MDRSFSIYIQNAARGDDQSVYFCDVQPTYEAEEVFAGKNRTPVIFRFVKFTPRNGMQQGNVMRVPMERVISIHEPSPSNTRQRDRVAQ